MNMPSKSIDISLRAIRHFVQFLHLLKEQRLFILFLAKREVASHYVGSALGLTWAVIHPMAMIFIFWMVFGVFFKSQPVGGVPYVVWLTAGLSAWYVFSDIVSGSCGVIVGYASLIKKAPIQSHLLPVVKIASCLVTHAFFLVILLVLILGHGLPLGLYGLQALYYLLCLCVLGLGLGWIVAALTPFYRDVAQIVSVLLQVGLWATPIMWDISLAPPAMRPVLGYNPVYYIVQGYRDSFLANIPFWERPGQGLAFWTVALTTFVLGGLLFKKLKPHFPDVL